MGKASGSGPLVEDLAAPFPTIILTFLETSRPTFGLTNTYLEFESAIGVHEGFWQCFYSQWQTMLLRGGASFTRQQLNLQTTTLRHRKSFCAMSSSMIPRNDLESFASHLNSSARILALLGAGLSAASGLPTFRGAGGLWRSHDAMSLATPEAFQSDPGLVWQFYSYRRHMALQARPNPAHYALAELAKCKKGFVALSQNVDGMHTYRLCFETN